MLSGRPSRRLLVCLLVLAALAAAAAPAPAADSGLRERSRTAHADLSAAEALALGRRTAPALLAPAADLHGGRVVKFLNDHVARVDTGEGRTGTIVDSSVPLRTRTGDAVDLALVDAGGSFAVAAPLVPVRIAKAAAGGATLAASGVGLVPVGAANRAGRQAGGAVFWANTFTDTDLTVRPIAGGFEASALIRSAAAPEDYAYRLVLPRGAVAVPGRRAGEVRIVRGDTTLARLSPSFAYDADGRPVALTQRLVGDELRIHVDHAGADVRYPLVLDPTLTDSFNWGAGQTNYDGWLPMGAHPAARFATGCRTGGCGLHLYDDVGVYNYPDGDQAIWWRYAAPNHPQVTVTGFNASGSLSQSGAQVCVRYSIANPGSFLAQDFECGPGPKGAALTSGGGQYAYFQAYMWFGGTRNWDAVTNSASVALTDPNAPAVSLTVPSGWTNNRGSGISASFTDPGLGTQSARLSGPTGWNGERSYTGTCGRVTCLPGGSFESSVGNLPNGSNPITLTATDRAGGAATVTKSAKVDDAQPSQSVSGTGWNPPGGALPPGSYTVNVSASDGHAGVKTTSVAIDGQPIRSNANASGGCDGCPLSTTATFNTRDYAPMQHEITVTTTDYAGNTRTSSSRVTFGDPLAPQSGCSSTASLLTGGHVAGTYSNVRMEAAGSGTTRLCYQLTGPAINQAGVLEIGVGVPAVGLPTADSNADACTNRVFSNTNALGTTSLAYEVVPGAVWVCVRAPGQSQRLVVPIAVSGLPSVRVAPVAAATPPPPRPWPAKASAGCTSSGGTLVTQFNVLDTGLWVAHRSTALGQLQVCVRAQNGSGSGAGGILTIDAGQVLGVVPQAGLSSDMTPCTVIINHLDDPVKLWLDASPPSTGSQSVCIQAEGGVIQHRIYVRTGSAGSPVTFTPDA